jgi:ribokinase
MNKPGVVTVGSINIDLVAYAQRRPQAGETFSGTRFTISAGGKGGNQAVAASLSGAHSYIIARLGKDIFAPFIYDVFDLTGVDHRYVFEDDAGTGIGHVTVDSEGDYSAVIIARANGNLSTVDVDQARPAFAASKVLLLQLETPLEASIYAARQARGIGLQVFLNAAPAAPLPEALLQNVDVLIVNEIETAMLTGLSVTDAVEQAEFALGALCRLTPEAVISLGARGCIARNRAGQIRCLPGHKVHVVNTVGAGDAFIGELAARMAEGLPLLDALPFANAAGAVAVTQPASHGLNPAREQILSLINTKAERSEGKEDICPNHR